ncbi:MAG: sigma-54 dependent transcriptional regulator [Phycisphaeraceae bacterium]
MTKILIVDDKQMMRDSVSATLVRAGFAAVTADGGEAALAMIGKHRPAAIVTDLKMPGMDGMELLRRVAQLDPQLPVVLMTAYATVETAVSAMKIGAFDYVQKPFDGDELIVTVKRAAEHYRLCTENEALKQTPGSFGHSGNHPLIGESAAMSRLRKQIEQVAASHGTVLIAGESGTGKEVVARHIHTLSPRNGRVMLAVNCAALSANLLESELFGHEKGAFTGADQLRKGRFELADGGTLLLDEVSEVDGATQAKLLRVLQERQFERVGSSITLDVDVRVIATTNRDLAVAVRDRAFREDLWFRLNVLPVHVPALRERRDDVAMLAEHFLKGQASRDGRTTKRFDAEALRVLREYDWPGNVRELQNICERAGVLAHGEVIDAGLIEPWLRSGSKLPGAGAALPGVNVADGRTLEEIEREMIVRTLGRYNGHRQRTASELGIGVRTLGLKLQKWKQSNLVSASL